MTSYLPLPNYRSVMEVLHSIKIFDAKFLPHFYVLKSCESKKVVFECWSLHMCVCVGGAFLGMGDSEGFISSKLIKI